MHKKFLVVKGAGAGGIGDRLRAVIAGIAYAKKTDRTLVVDWRDGLYGEPGDEVFSRLFRINNIDHLPPDSLDHEQDVWPPAWSGRLSKGMTHVYVADGNPPWDRRDAIERYSFDLSRYDYEHRVLVLWEFDQMHKLVDDKSINPNALCIDAFTSAIARRHILPNERIQSKVATARRNKRKCIGLHVRRTNESVSQKGQVELSQYISFIDKWSKSGKYDLFLATDNLDVIHEMQACYGKVFLHDKWLPVPGEPLHLNDQCPDTYRTAEEAVVDMFSLASCDKLIIQANSSFGIAAKLFSDVKGDDCVALLPEPNRFKRYIKKILAMAK